MPIISSIVLFSVKSFVSVILNVDLLEMLSKNHVFVAPLPLNLLIGFNPSTEASWLLSNTTIAEKLKTLLKLSCDALEDS